MPSLPPGVRSLRIVFDLVAYACLTRRGGRERSWRGQRGRGEASSQWKNPKADRSDRRAEPNARAASRRRERRRDAAMAPDARACARRRSRRSMRLAVRPDGSTRPSSISPGKNQRGAVRQRPASGYDVADAREMTATRRGRDVHARRMTSSRWEASRGDAVAVRDGAMRGTAVGFLAGKGFPGVPPPRLRDARMRPARRPRRARRDGRLNAPAAVGDTLHHLARSAVGKGRARASPRLLRRIRAHAVRELARIFRRARLPVKPPSKKKKRARNFTTARTLTREYQN